MNLRIQSLLLVVGLAASATAEPQGSASSKIVIGDGFRSVGSHANYTGGTQVPFKNAMDALELLGGQRSGTIEVMPGTYTFEEQVVVKVPGVRITGGPNAIITPDGNLFSACFMVESTATDLVIDGVTLLDERDAPPPIAFLDVQAHRFTLQNCRVQVSNGTEPTTISNAIRILGAVNEELYGALIQSNAFVAGRLEDPEPESGGGGTPTVVEAKGRVLVRSEHGRNLRILGNTFQSGAVPDSNVVVNLRSAISLEHEEWTSIGGNTFSYIRSPDPVGGGPEEYALVACTTSIPGQESTHLTITGNYFERCSGRSIVSLKGTGFSTITGNAFGRLGAGESGSVFLSGGQGNVVSSNGFHNVGTQPTTPSIRAIDERGIGIHSNSFAIPLGTQVILEGVTGALVNGNQFLKPDNTNNDPHLFLDDVTGASIVGNRFAGASMCPAIGGSTAQQSLPVFICANLFDGCGTPWATLLDPIVVTCESAGNGGNPDF